MIGFLSPSRWPQLIALYPQAQIEPTNLSQHKTESTWISPTPLWWTPQPYYRTWSLSQLPQRLNHKWPTYHLPHMPNGDDHDCEESPSNTPQSPINVIQMFTPSLGNSNGDNQNGNSSTSNYIQMELKSLRQNIVHRTSTKNMEGDQDKQWSLVKNPGRKLPPLVVYVPSKSHHA